MSCVVWPDYVWLGPLMPSYPHPLSWTVFAMQFAPNSSEPSKESNTVVVDHSETTNAKKSD